jgi:CheY-like chemotaxis protein
VAVLCLMLATVVCLAGGVLAGEKANAPVPTKTVSDSLASEMEVAAFGKALTNQLAFLESQKAAARSSSSHEIIWTVTGIALLGMVVMLKYVPRFLGMRDFQVEAQNSAWAAAANGPAEMVAEEQSFADFAAKFRVGPLEQFPPRREAALSPSAVALPKAMPEVERIDPIKAFFALTPPRIAGMRALLDNLDAAPSIQTLFTQLAASALELKNDSHVQALTPVWQVASALEALANQLGQKARSVTPSTIRTVTAAVDLIEALAKPGLDPALASTPPIRVLAVDDDPISRHAVAFALKKALNLPDLAANGPSALELAAQTAYDAIFLDIQMPGMDGFELCKRLHETERNREVPVVFITCQNDFEARAKSTDAGGCDLIGKPFLTFEVTLKALTLVLRARLAGKTVAKIPVIEKTAPAPALALAT